jgi:CubicO group peptidase (beta-lactamase class C family)
MAEGAHGLAFGVELAGERVFAGGFGAIDDRATVRASADAPFRAGALLPAFLAVAALRLAERETLELGAPLSKYVPGFADGDPPVSVEMLLAHTSGIPSYADWLEATESLAKPLDPEGILAWLAQGPREFEPGSCVAYSPTNDFLLACVLEAVTEQAIAEHLEEALFGPAGMSDTGWCFEGPLSFARAPVRQELGEGYEDLRGAPAPCAAEGLCTTVEDLLSFQRALVAGELLGEASLGRRAKPAGGPASSSGLGLALSFLDEIVCQSLGGALAGYAVHLAYYPDLEATIVVLASGTEVAPQTIAAEVARVLFARARPEARDVELSPEARAAYVGEYYAGCTSYGIAAEGAGLVLVPPSGPRHRLRYQGGEVFVSALDPEVRLEFEREDGRVTVLVLAERGISLRARRVN